MLGSCQSAMDSPLVTRASEWPSPSSAFQCDELPSISHKSNNLQGKRDMMSRRSNASNREQLTIMCMDLGIHLFHVSGAATNTCFDFVDYFLNEPFGSSPVQRAQRHFWAACFCLANSPKTWRYSICNEKTYQYTYWNVPNVGWVLSWKSTWYVFILHSPN